MDLVFFLKYGGPIPGALEKTYTTIFEKQHLVPYTRDIGLSNGMRFALMYKRGITFAIYGYLVLA